MLRRVSVGVRVIVRVTQVPFFLRRYPFSRAVQSSVLTKGPESLPTTVHERYGFLLAESLIPTLPLSRIAVCCPLDQVQPDFEGEEGNYEV